MKARLHHGEILVKQGFANATRGIESVGGKLYLTTRRLIFESHQFNIQTGPTFIDLDHISNSGVGKTLVFGKFRLVPNMFYVDTTVGRFEFVVNSRKKWKEAVDALTSARP